MGYIERLAERILQHIILIFLFLIFGIILVTIEGLIFSIIKGELLDPIYGIAIALALSFFFLHYVLVMSKENIIIKIFIYLLSVYLVFSFIVSNVHRLSLLDLFLTSTISYELSSLVYKLLAKTDLFNKIRKTVGAKGEKTE